MALLVTDSPAGMLSSPFGICGGAMHSSLPNHRLIHSVTCDSLSYLWLAVACPGSLLMSAYFDTKQHDSCGQFCCHPFLQSTPSLPSLYKSLHLNFSPLTSLPILSRGRAELPPLFYPRTVSSPPHRPLSPVGAASAQCSTTVCSARAVLRARPAASRSATAT